MCEHTNQMLAGNNGVMYMSTNDKKEQKCVKGRVNEGNWTQLSRVGIWFVRNYATEDYECCRQTNVNHIAPPLRATVSCLSKPFEALACGTTQLEPICFRVRFTRKSMQIRHICSDPCSQFWSNMTTPLLYSIWPKNETVNRENCCQIATTYRPGVLRRELIDERLRRRQNQERETLAFASVYGCIC